jgi:hypothetical protein
MKASNDQYSDLQEATERVKAVKRTHEDELLNKANVVGVGVGYRRIGGEATRTPALVVMVSQKLPAALLGEDDLIPAWLDGVPVDVQEVGEITAY